MISRSRDDRESRVGARRWRASNCSWVVLKQTILFFLPCIESSFHDAERKGSQWEFAPFNSCPGLRTSGDRPHSPACLLFDVRSPLDAGFAEQPHFAVSVGIGARPSRGGLLGRRACTSLRTLFVPYAAVQPWTSVQVRRGSRSTPGIAYRRVWH
jgi:hypothetical protein